MRVVGGQADGLRWDQGAACRAGAAASRNAVCRRSHLVLVSVEELGRLDPIGVLRGDATPLRVEGIVRDRNGQELD